MPAGRIMAAPASATNTARAITPPSRSTPTATASKPSAAPLQAEEKPNAGPHSQTALEGRRAAGAGARHDTAPQPEFAPPAHRPVAPRRIAARACLLGAHPAGQGLLRLPFPHDRGGMGLYPVGARPR